jgi:hypothetical protein
VVEDGGLQDQNWCASKLPLTTPQSHDYSTSNLREARGHPLVIRPRPDPKKISVNEAREWWLKPQLTP